MNFIDMIRHCKVVERVVRAPIERWLDHVLYFLLGGCARIALMGREQ